MLRLPPFEYHAPSNIAEAVALKAELGDSAMYSAGGTDLFPNMKRRQFTPQNLIGLTDLDRNYVPFPRKNQRMDCSSVPEFP